MVMLGDEFENKKFKKIVYFFSQLRYSKNYQKNKIHTMIGFQ